MAARILSWGLSDVGARLGRSPTALVKQALQKAMDRAGVAKSPVLDGFVACPSLADPRFMEAHYLASACGVLPGMGYGSGVRVRTIDTGGASPISMLLQAKRMVETEGCTAVAVVAGDAVSSMPSAAFLDKADSAASLMAASDLPEGTDVYEFPSPGIPNGYSHAAAAHMKRHPLSRNQLAMVPVLMSHQAARHPQAMAKRPISLDSVLQAPAITPLVGQFECARRADGAAAVLVVREDAISLVTGGAGGAGLKITGGGEAGGCAFLPKDLDRVLDCLTGARSAFDQAYASAGISPKDVDWFGIYDCYPICFIRGLEAAGLCPEGGGGRFVEDLYGRLQSGGLSADDFPINTHGGLLSFGAPWEVPSLFSVVEACEQLSGNAGGGRQVSGCKRAIVYGNGGVFGASAVAVLEAETPH